MGPRCRIEKTVGNILHDVRLHGDDAVLKYARRFDKFNSKTARSLRVTDNETNAAYGSIRPSFISTLKAIFENVNSFYKRQVPKSWRMKGPDGEWMGKIYNPIERVGVYIPAGTAPLVSTVYMTVLPAKIAGVPDITLATPPRPDGSVDPHTLVVANLLKVNRIFKVGGAQAIGAMAYGTKTIPRVDKIVGPGNAYVTEAKRQVYGYVDLDMLAGPSEVVILANHNASAAHVIGDLKAQAEHKGGMAILVTPSKLLAKAVQAKVSGGYVVMVKNLDQGVEVVNQLAPEHLEIIVKDPRKVLSKIRNAGTILVGPYSPAAVTDYYVGPSHVLPTGGTARWSSGLDVEAFIKSSHVVCYTKKALDQAREAVGKIAGIEGLSEHIESIEARFK
ncbi:MAG: histidinol dehydrogenase [Candidatus Omnitrophica bacterium]|nr:histidinol dehydrogenase [Candidatus Omnitrophota bacterium]